MLSKKNKNKLRNKERSNIFVSENGDSIEFSNDKELDRMRTLRNNLIYLHGDDESYPSRLDYEINRTAEFCRGNEYLGSTIIESLERKLGDRVHELSKLPTKAHVRISHDLIDKLSSLKLKSSHLAMITVLLRFHPCYPGRRKLSKLLGICIRTVDRIITDLRKMGLKTVTLGDNATNFYFIRDFLDTLSDTGEYPLERYLYLHLKNATTHPLTESELFFQLTNSVAPKYKSRRKSLGKKKKGLIVKKTHRKK